MYGFTYRAGCPACGHPFERSAGGAHVCDADVRAALDAFEDELAAWLASPRGRFAVWDAARSR
jgi:hypothetical protein